MLARPAPVRPEVGPFVVRRHRDRPNDITLRGGGAQKRRARSINPQRTTSPRKPILCDSRFAQSLRCKTNAEEKHVLRAERPQQCRLRVSDEIDTPRGTFRKSSFQGGGVAFRTDSAIHGRIRTRVPCARTAKIFKWGVGV